MLFSLISRPVRFSHKECGGPGIFWFSCAWCQG